MSGPVLVVDWDGTVTERDTLHLVVERYGDPDVFAAMERALDTLSLDEVIAAEMATVHAPVSSVAEWLRTAVRVRPGFAELVARHDPLIVSAGFHELIEPILEREGLQARVLANRVTDGPDGWEAVFRPRALCPVCGERCKRVLLADLGPYVYVGDGVSDRCASLGAERVFARDGLAGWLDAQGIAYEPFDTLHDVDAALTAPSRRSGPGSPPRPG